MDRKDLEKLLGGLDEYCEPSMYALQEENFTLRRALRVMARKYTSIKIELETTRSSVGYYNKYFRFLELPREVRDQIYDYALVSSMMIVSPEAGLETVSGLEDPTWLPPTPGILLVNKKISLEAAKVLYSRNGFKFLKPHDLLRFEETIGSCNRDYMQQIFIYMEDRDTLPVQYLEATPQCDWKAIPFHWSLALIKSRLNNVIDMTIIIHNRALWDESDEKVTTSLEKAIKNFLSRNQKPKIPPRLIFSGFNKSECDKFSKNWNVKSELDAEKDYITYP